MGIITYFAVKKDEPNLGNNCLKVGIIVFVTNLSVGFFSIRMI